MDSLLEQLALENPKVASSRGALGLRQQVRPLQQTKHQFPAYRHCMALPA